MSSRSSKSDRPPRRLGIAGLGRIWQHQAEALRRSGSEKFEIIGACDPAARPDVTLDVPVFGSVADLIAELHPDAIVVSVPTGLHREVAEEVLSAGIHVLLEKPAVVELIDLNELYRCASANAVVLQVAYHAAVSPEVEWVVANLPGLVAELGNIRHVRAVYLDPYAAGGVIAAPAHSLVSSWLDSGINALSVLDRLFQVQLVAFRTTVIDAIWPGDLRATATVRLADRATGTTSMGVVDTDWTTRLNAKATWLSLSSGVTVHIDHSSHAVRLRPDAAGETRLLFEVDSSPPRLASHYQAVFTEFAAAIDAGSPNVEQTRRLHALLLDTTSLPPM